MHESHQLSGATLVEHPNCLMIGIALLNSYMTPERDIVKQWKHRPLNSCHVIFILVHICHISDLLNSVDSCTLLLQFFVGLGVKFSCLEILLWKKNGKYDVCMQAKKNDNNEEANDNRYIAPAL